MATAAPTLGNAEYQLFALGNARCNGTNPLTLPDTGPSPEEQAAQREFDRNLQAVLAGLPENQRLAMALLVFALRQVLTDAQWSTPEKFVRVSFWGLNVGLGLMVLSNLFPGGVLQLVDVLNHGYWHARSTEFLNARIVRYIEWARLPADIIFIVAGVVPVVVASGLAYRAMRQSPVRKS